MDSWAADNQTGYNSWPGWPELHAGKPAGNGQLHLPERYGDAFPYL
jgi:hypothetical protein